jgi:hypothetical protein
LALIPPSAPPPARWPRPKGPPPIATPMAPPPTPRCCAASQLACPIASSASRRSCFLDLRPAPARAPPLPAMLEENREAEEWRSGEEWRVGRRALRTFVYGRSEAISDTLIVERRRPSAPKRHFDCRSRALIGSEPIFEYGRKSLANALVSARDAHACVPPVAI